MPWCFVRIQVVVSNCYMLFHAFNIFQCSIQLLPFHPLPIQISSSSAPVCCWATESACADSGMVAAVAAAVALCSAFAKAWCSFSILGTHFRHWQLSNSIESNSTQKGSDHILSSSFITFIVYMVTMLTSLTGERI